MTNQHCPDCNSPMAKDGFTPSRRQRYECPNCGKKTSTPPAAPIENFGKILTEIRESKGLSLQQVCDTLGYHKAWLSRIENSKGKIGMDQFLELAYFYEMRPSEILLKHEQQYYNEK